jgi:hypothetical protein
MSIAVTAFDNSGHNPSLIARVHRDYTEKCNVVISTTANGQNVTNGTGYDFFASFYVKELRLLYEEGDRGKAQQQQAHLTEALQRINELESQMETQEANMHQVNDNVHEMAASAAAKSSGSTGTHSTGMSTITEDGMAKMIAAMVANAVKAVTPSKSNGKGGGGGNGGGGTAPPLRKFRKYDKYCSSRGINLWCDGQGECRRSCERKPNHDSSATYDNRKGGSDRLEERWGKWCGPDDKVYANKADYTGPTLPDDN